MHEKNCPVCEGPIEIPDSAKIGDRLTCPNCFAQLALYKHKKEQIIGCAICKEAVFNPENCEDCTRREEKKRLLEEGRL
ncbi:MAG: hypothetical protein ABIA67_02560 [Candidatus Margulisiibacteriota bacterium]